MSGYVPIPLICGFFESGVKMILGLSHCWPFYTINHLYHQDVGGQDKIRPLWRHYFTGTNALIFVVDSSDLVRMEEARAEFLRIITDNEMQRARVLVFANKIDLPRAASVGEISELLGLQKLNGNKEWFVQATCAKTGEGLSDGINWLRDSLVAKKDKKKKKK